jgi:hypothetical protein
MADTIDISRKRDSDKAETLAAMPLKIMWRREKPTKSKMSKHTNEKTANK